MIILKILILSLAFADFDETLLQAPKKDSDTESIYAVICRTRTHLRWDICSSLRPDNSESVKSFKFSNMGENKIVKKSGFGIGRDFEFLFEDQARSDLGLLIWDMPDQKESHGHLKLMMFFPRTYLPKASYYADDNKDTITVMLPNGEDVIFNGKTKEIIGGVLSEAPMEQDKEGNAIEPQVNYSGAGVVLWAHAINDYPVGLSPKELLANKKAYIKKAGKKLCIVNANELWYTDDSLGGNILFNKKYVTDLAFDRFTKNKCGFSIY